MNQLLADLVNGAILGTLLTATVWLVLRLTPRRVLNAATRYALWWATLAVVVALPLFYLPRAPRVVSVKALPRAALAVRAMPVMPVSAPRSMGQAWRPAPTPPIQIEASRWPRWILLSWAAISLLLLMRLFASFLLLARTSSRAQDARRPFAQLLALSTSRRGVRVAGSDEIAIPVAVGPWRPAILIPASLLDELEPAEFEQIVLHEASHLARRDDYSLLLQRIVEAVFALHPVVRWIARCIDLEREVACDDRVIAVTGRPYSYASCLTRVVEFSCGERSSLAAASAADHSSHLARRVDMLLDKTRHTGTHLLKARLTAMLALVAALAWLAGRSPGFVAFAAPLVHTLQRVPARILPHAAALFPNTAEAPQAGTPDFDGRVLEDSSGNPLASAEIRFRKPGMRELAADLETDRNGRARAAGLSPGEYSVEVLKPNFVTTSLKVRIPAAGFTVRLVRYGVISGQITDQRGEPAPAFIHAPGGRTVGGTRVALLTKDPATGQLQLLREHYLEEGGRYRIYDLTPGQYAIGVWYDGLKDGSGVQLHPDNAHPRFFTVSGGEEYDHIDFLITPQATFRVSGMVEGSKKGQSYALSISLPEQPALPIAQAWTDDDGTFRFEKIPAGSYDLFAGGPTRGYGAHDALLGPSPLFGRMNLQVGQNVEGLSIPVSGGKSITVALHAQNAATPPSGCPKAAGVGAMPLDPWGLMFNANVNTQVEFGKEGEIKNLAPGRFRIYAMGLPEGCYQMNQPVADLSGERAAPITVELATAGSIRGTLKGAARPSEYSVVLLDAGGSPDSTTQISQADAQGRFSFESLHPGRYRIAAQTGNSRNVSDVSKMVEIEVPAGAPTDVDLPVAAKGGRQ